jgi:hypothetical protein
MAGTFDFFFRPWLAPAPPPPPQYLLETQILPSHRSVAAAAADKDHKNALLVLPNSIPAGQDVSC